jgi:hypothetical protein
VIPGFTARYGDMGLSVSRGYGKQYLGEVGAASLTGTLTGSSRFSYLQQMRRILLQGASLHLRSDPIDAVVWIRDVKVRDMSQTAIMYSLSLEESLFVQGHSCDSASDFSVDNGGGSLSAVSSTPTPQEGSYCVKLSGTIAANTESRMRCTPTDNLDMSNKAWPSFWYYTDKIIDLSACVAKFFHDAGNYATYDFKAQLLAAGAWRRIAIPKASATETGTMEWDDVDYFTISQKHTSQQTYYFAVDDVGAYE